MALLFSTLIVNSPFSSVTAMLLLPFSVTVIPGRGTPCSSITLPVTFSEAVGAVFSGVSTAGGDLNEG